MLACVVAGFACATPAGAVTVTLGPQDLSASDPFAECDLSCSSFKTFVPTAVPGGAAITPADGTIVSWRVKGAPPNRLRLRVVEDVGGGSFRGANTSGVAKQSDGVGDNPAAIDIDAGQQLGIDVTSNSPTVDPSVLLGDATAPGAAWSGFSSGLGEKESATPTESGSGSLPLFNATVELFEPRIVHMTSTSGPAGGDDIVVLTGQHLAIATAVKFGSVPAAQVLKADGNQVIAVAPPHAPGVVEVSVETAGGSSLASLADRYEYLPAVPPDPGPDEAPLLSAMRLSPKAFRAAGRGPSAIAAAAVGTRVTYRSSEAARVKFVVQRRVRRGFRRLRGAIVRRAAAGANAFRFTGRLRGRRLRPGLYRFFAAATDATGKRSRPVRRSFRVLRGRSRQGQHR